MELPIDSLINCEHILLYERQSPEGTMKRFFCEENSVEIELTFTEFESLLLLAKNVGMIYSKEQML